MNPDVNTPKFVDLIRSTGWRSTLLLILGISLISACVSGSNVPDPSKSCDSEVRSKSQLPNVVVIMTDDQTSEQVRVMPNVQELLRAQGTSFDNMVVNDADCCPSRATFLTGLQSRHHGLLWNTPPTGGFANFEGQETTLPVVLSRGGYQTGFVGKYMNRFGERNPEDRVVPPGWTDFRGLVFPAESVYYEAAFFENGRVVETPSTEYVTSAITDRAIEMINSFSNSGDPFFLQIGHVAPHSPGGVPLSQAKPGWISEVLSDDYESFPVPEPRYQGRFANEDLPISPAFNEADISDKALVNQRQFMDPSVVDEVTERYRRTLETLLSVDDSVGAVIAALEENCILDETYVIFTSDNGQFFGEHRFPLGKYLPYRPSRSVPLIVRGPGVQRSVTLRSVVSNVDLAPTIAEWTLTSLIRDPDGLSLAKMLEIGEAAERGRAVYLEGHAPEGRLIIPFDAVYTGNVLYIEMSDGSVEFYDLALDPDELENRATDPAYATAVSDASTLLRELRDCSGSPCGAIGSHLPVP